MNTAVYYTSTRPAPGQEGQIYGLNVAISDWLKAYFSYSREEKFTFLIGHKNEVEDVEQIADYVNLDRARLVILDRRYLQQNFTQFDNVFRPEPGTRNMLWLRQAVPGFSFCGLAHAISGTEAGEVLQEYCLSPSEPSDAIICPSKAVASAVRSFWNSYSEFLRLRFGVSYNCPVQLPVIPLGINCSKFERRAHQDHRAGQRAALGIAPDEPVILWVGRLSAAIKAHPISMFRACERAAELTGKRVTFVMLGYFLSDDSRQEFEALAKLVCVAAKVIFVDAHDPRFPDGLWSSADIFLSLIDNFQESFGLTPVEAMAAGLPRVLSDWDGYRDSVRDGEDGFLIRTSQPPPGQGKELTLQVASGQESYGGFLAKAALTVATDTEQAGQRLAQLFNDPSRRASMSASARQRANTLYDWRNIIPLFEELWTSLSMQRAKHAMPPPAWPGAVPTLPDPFTMYQLYPSHRLSADDRVKINMSLEEFAALLPYTLNTYAYDILLPSSELTILLGWLKERQEVTIAEVLQRFSRQKQPSVWCTVGWLLKLGALKKRLRPGLL